MPEAVTAKTIEAWADSEKDPVALHIKQKLLPVEGTVAYPPTYADIGYNIDTLADGTKVALIDSVGSQANRIEPIFKRAPYSTLVPQIEIELYSKEDGSEIMEKCSLLDLAHRSADAVVYASPKLSAIVSDAFGALKQRGDAAPLCRVAPTSLVFGVWDSRGGSNEKRPRLIRSIIRAWDVDVLHAAAQFNSVWKSLHEDDQAELRDEEGKRNRMKRADAGLADTPAVFRKTKIPEYRNGFPNPEARVLGGIVIRGGVERDVTVNLVALRGLVGANDEETVKLRRYLLALTLIAATAEIDLYLREGCHLRYAEDDDWKEIPRRGDVVPIDLASKQAQDALLQYALEAVTPFRARWPKELRYKFDLRAAKKLLVKSGNMEE